MADIPSRSEYLNTQSNLVHSNLDKKAEAMLTRIAKELSTHRPLPFTFYIHQELILPKGAEYSAYSGQYKAIIDYVVETMKAKGWSILFQQERGGWDQYDNENISVTIK